MYIYMFSGFIYKCFQDLFSPVTPTNAQFSLFRGKKIVPHGSGSMPKLEPHETRRMPRTQTTVGRGHDSGFAERNERAF